MTLSFLIIWRFSPKKAIWGLLLANRCSLCYPKCTFVSLTVTHSFSFSFIIFDHQRFAFLWHGFFSFVCLELTASSISRRWTWSFQALIIKHSFVKEWKSTHGMSIGSIIVSETHFMCFVCFIIINVIVPCMSPTFKTRQELN